MKSVFYFMLPMFAVMVSFVYLYFSSLYSHETASSDFLQANSEIEAQGFTEAQIIQYDSFLSPEMAVQHFESIAKSFSDYREMVVWLNSNRFVVAEHRGLDAGSVDNEDAIKLLAGFSAPLRDRSVPNSALGQVFELFRRQFDSWSFIDQHTGLTILYSNESTFSEVKLNPRGI